MSIYTAKYLLDNWDQSDFKSQPDIGWYSGCRWFPGDISIYYDVSRNTTGSLIQYFIKAAIFVSGARDGDIFHYNMDTDINFKPYIIEDICKTLVDSYAPYIKPFLERYIDFTSDIELLGDVGSDLFQYRCREHNSGIALLPLHGSTNISTVIGIGNMSMLYCQLSRWCEKMCKGKVYHITDSVENSLLLFESKKDAMLFRLNFNIESTEKKTIILENKQLTL